MQNIAVDPLASSVGRGSYVESNAPTYQVRLFHVDTLYPVVSCVNKSIADIAGHKFSQEVTRMSRPRVQEAESSMHLSFWWHAKR